METRQGRYRFVGRVPELTHLKRALEAATAGHGSVTFVEGIAGMGKTRLLDEALARAKVNTKRAASRELEQGRPFGVFVDALSLDPKDLSLGPTQEPLERPQTFAAVDEILRTIEDLGMKGPLALTLEDLHWVDEPSCMVLDRLLHLSHGLPVALICNLRPDPAPAALQVVLENAARLGATTLTLQPLGIEERSGFVEEILGGMPGPHLEQTIDGASGNPLFIEEILSSLLEEKSVAKRDGVVDTEVDIAPTNFRLAILRRFSSLPEDSLALLRVGAALGGTFTISDLTSATETPVEDIPRVLRAPIANGLLSAEERSFAFAHDLVRDAIYYDSPEPLRAAMHRRLAARLAASGAPAEQIAEQAYRGGSPGDEDCIGWLRAAGRSRASDSPGTAIRYLTRALELAATPNACAQIQAELVRPLMWGARLDKAESTARAALPLIEDPSDRASLMTDLGHVMYLQDDYHSGFAEMKRAAETPGLDKSERARRLATMAHVANEYSPELEDAAKDALRLAIEADDLSTQAFALSALSKLARGRDDVHASLELAEQAYAKAQLSGDAAAVYSAALRLVPPLFHLDRFADALSLLEETIEAAERTGSTWLMPQFISQRGAASYFLGDWDEAVRDLEESLRMGASNKLPAEQTSVASCLAILNIRRGDLSRADALLDEWSPKELVEDNEPQYRWARAMLANARGNLEEAAAEARVVFDTYGSKWGPMAVLTGGDLVSVLVDAGELDLATRYTARIEAVAEKTGTVCSKATLLRCRGLLEGDPEPIAIATKLLSGIGRLLQEADTHMDAGRLFVAQTQQDKAAPHLLAAVDLYTKLGADPSVRRAQALLRTLGIRSGSKGVRGRPETGWESLTPSEASVAQLVADGLSNSEIAERLFVSKKTVETHLGRVFRKLDARSRIDVAKQVLSRREDNILNEVRQDP